MGVVFVSTIKLSPQRESVADAGVFEVEQQMRTTAQRACNSLVPIWSFVTASLQNEVDEKLARHRFELTRPNTFIRAIAMIP